MLTVPRIYRRDSASLHVSRDCESPRPADCPNQLYKACVIIIIIISIIGVGTSLPKMVKPVDLRATSTRVHSFRSGGNRTGAIEMQ